MSTQVKMAAQRERSHSETIFADECLYQCGCRNFHFSSRDLKTSHLFSIEDRSVGRTGCLPMTVSSRVELSGATLECAKPIDRCAFVEPAWLGKSSNLLKRRAVFPNRFRPRPVVNELPLPPRINQVGIRQNFEVM